MRGVAHLEIRSKSLPVAVSSVATAAIGLKLLCLLPDADLLHISAGMGTRRLMPAPGCLSLYDDPLVYAAQA